MNPGLLSCIFQLKKFNPFSFGDSSVEDKRAKLDEFCDRIDKVGHLVGIKPLTLKETRSVTT